MLRWQPFRFSVSGFQISWAIVVFGALLCHTNQNIHYYDGDLQYDDLKRAAHQGLW